MIVSQKLLNLFYFQIIVKYHDNENGESDSRLQEEDEDGNENANCFDPSCNCFNYKFIYVNNYLQIL